MGRRRNPRTEIAAERRVQSLELRKRGLSYRAIGRELGISEAQAHRDVHKVLDEFAALERESGEKIRRIELMRLDAMVKGLWDGIERGDPSSVTSALRVSERRARLLGLDAPTKSEVTGADGGPLAVSSQVDLSKLSDSDLATLATILDRASSADS